MELADEMDLIARCRRGDLDAWDLLFCEHYAPACRFVFQLISDLSHEDTEDIVQESFHAAIQRIRQFRGNCRFQTWLFRIAANKARDFLDKKNALKRGGGMSDVSIDAENPETGLVAQQVSDEPHPIESLASHENTIFIGEALGTLGENCREIIQLRYFADLSYEEISKALEVNAKTVSSRLSKCLSKLEAMTLVILKKANEIQFPSNL
ncbi:sigma-70 family RNA polymerase sigma factor [Verrucomicrobia bacterium]|nr:sigma-70 family RNA polymerase sigma factor [Verrucomicrobiota bacterium]MDB4458951.1 sigma-70 family RNA polymerase sigma factor [bacterium]